MYRASYYFHLRFVFIILQRSRRAPPIMLSERMVILWLCYSGAFQEVVRGASITFESDRESLKLLK